MSTKVTEYINKKETWKTELETLREVLLDLPLEETIKWGAPTYTYEGKNVVGIAGFKSYFGLWFFQGALLKDTHKVFINAQEGKTKAMLQWRFSTLEDINADLIKEYILEAIENQKQNKVIKPARNTKPLRIPELLQNALNSNKELHNSFEAFSLSKKREYADYISEAKREATKEKRLNKIIPMIMQNIGLHDKYRNC